MQKEYLIVIVATIVAITMFMPVSAYTVKDEISKGATVFLGEQGLNITPAMEGDTQIGWWSSGASITGSSPSSGAITVSNPSDYTIMPGLFSSQLGVWYHLNAVGAANGTVFNVQDPYITLDIIDITTVNQVVSGATVVQGDTIGFKVGTNMYSVYDTNRNGSNNGWADIIIKTSQGGTYTALSNKSGFTNTLVNQKINTSPWMWGDAINGWDTTAYPSGGYSVYVESQLNGMKDNYKNNGADYTGKTISAIKTVSVVSNNLQITPNVDTVAQSKRFSVSITGKPNQVYHIWVKGTSGMNSITDQPPMIMQSQLGVIQDINGTDLASTKAIALTNNQSALGYHYQNGGIIIDDVSTNNYTNWGSACAANVTLSQYGTRTVEFTTTPLTKAQKYTIRIEQNFNGQYMYDEVDIKVIKGNLMIEASGDGVYYIGEDIKLSGVNSVSDKTYLFLTGPNLNTVGSKINDLNPRNAPITKIDSDYPTVVVNGDNTWSWTWGTGNIALDTGTYTVWATSQKADASSSSLSDVSYGTVSVSIRKPFVSAIASETILAKGDILTIRGVAEGSPSSGVQIWLLGKNYADVRTQSTNSDASFTYELPAATTNSLFPGQYFVIVQHPMQNGVFDISYNPVTGYVYNNQLGSGMTIFKLTGSGSLQGSDAAEALIQSINDVNIDDMYTKFQFIIDNPYIRIHPISYKQIGTRFPIIADTNLAPDDVVMVEVYSSSFTPTQKGAGGEFSGATGTVKVIKGTDANIIIFDIDTSTFQADEYTVTETAIIQDVIGTSVFTIGTTPATIILPVENASVSNVTTVSTPVPTQTVITANTTVPVTTEPTETPGFGAYYALSGIIVIAFIVSQRKD